MPALLRGCILLPGLLLGLLAGAGPAAAQWTRVAALPASDIFALWAKGDTIAAAADTAVYVSVDAGATWQRSARIAAGVTQTGGVWVRNHRLYVGTLGQGVFVSDDLGGTWMDFNQGLVGGFGNSQLNIRDLLVRGDSLYAATDGSGAWVRNLGGPAGWADFGNAFDSSNMLAIAANDTRLLAAAGFNGDVFSRDRGAADWTLQWLVNGAPTPGLAALAAVWTGRGWVVGTNRGVFVSPLGQEPWTAAGPDLGLLFGMAFAQRGRVLFASFSPGLSTQFESSTDDGATWQALDALPTTGVYRMAVVGDVLYAGGTDGLWRRPVATVPVPDGRAGAGLRLAIAGAQPVGDTVHFRLQLPAAGRIAIEVYDVAGRRVAEPVRGSFPAGPSEINWSARGLAPGVYHARLTLGPERTVVRMVRAR